MTILMSHNYSHDLEMLRFLLASPARYIGVMGPRKRTERMLRELAAEENSFLPEEAPGAPSLPGRSRHRRERLPPRSRCRSSPRCGRCSTGGAAGCCASVGAPSTAARVMASTSPPTEKLLLDGGVVRVKSTRRASDGGRKQLDGVGAIILAAGSSSRMGSPKQILQFRGQSLLRHAALAALDAGCAP